MESSNLWNMCIVEKYGQLVAGGPVSQKAHLTKLPDFLFFWSHLFEINAIGLYQSITSVRAVYDITKQGLSVYQ